MSPTKLAASIYVGNYTVGFVQIGKGGRKLLGSGTLIAADETRGVLTTVSVLEELPNAGPLGFVLCTELGQISLEASELSYLTATSGLGVVKLPAGAARRFDERKRFVNLPVVSNSLAGDWVWCVNGFTSELTTTELPLDCFDMVVGYTSATSVAEVTARAEIDTELEIEIDAAEIDGFIGGGLWRIEVADDSSRRWVTQAMLSGVVISIVGADRARCDHRLPVEEIVHALVRKT